MAIDMHEFEEQINMMMARAELAGETCGLKHSIEDPAENHPAVDYLCQGLGNQKTGEVFQEIRIPVCAECSDALYDPNWILMYCTYCHHSQWLSRLIAKNSYPDGNLIYWMDKCPFCIDEPD